MGNFSEHIQHSKKNLSFLSQISLNVENCWDWQVTVCFYTALHLINAHIAKTTNSNYLSHKQVDEIINPFNQLSLAKLDEDTYKSYSKLFQLSRRSRYLLNENFDNSSSIQIASQTYSKHLQKAIYHLNVVIDFTSKHYNQQFDITTIRCLDLKNTPFKHFNIKV